MGVDFINNLSISQAAIPAAVSRIAGFILVVQIALILLKKRSNPLQDAWSDIHDVLLAGLIVYFFPELIKFFELLVNTLCHFEVKQGSDILEYLKDTNISDGQEEPGGTASISAPMQLALFIARIAAGDVGLTDVATPVTYLLTNSLLKPLADLMNTLCFPTYMLIRAACLKVVYFVAPLVIITGALPPFRSLWKQWFMIYIALLVSGPALFLANDFCEEAFSLYIDATSSPMLGFLMIAMARFKIFQAVVDLCYRIFKV